MVNGIDVSWTPTDPSARRYLHDPIFHQLVDAMVIQLLNGTLSRGDFEEALTVAEGITRQKKLEAMFR